MELADREGIAALSMRRLAAELGIEAMSLYYYVRSKDDILDGIYDLAFSEVEPPSGSSDWKSDVRRSAMSYHDTLGRHRVGDQRVDLGRRIRGPVPLHGHATQAASRGGTVA